MLDRFVDRPFTVKTLSNQFRFHHFMHMHESIDNGAVSCQISKYLFSENGRFRRKHNRKRPTVQHNDNSQMFKISNFRQTSPINSAGSVCSFPLKLYRFRVDAPNYKLIPLAAVGVCAHAKSRWLFPFIALLFFSFISWIFLFSPEHRHFIK